MALSQEEQDAALARALQSQYDRTPPTPSATHRVSFATAQESMSEEEYRQLEEAQAQARAMARAMATTAETPRSSGMSSSSTSYQDEPRNSSNSNGGGGVGVGVGVGDDVMDYGHGHKEDDTDDAERMQQEFDDAAIAARLQRHEDRKAAREQRKREGRRSFRPGFGTMGRNNGNSKSMRESFYKYSGYVFPVNEQGKCTRPQRRHYISMTLLVLVATGIIVALFVHFIILDGDVPSFVEDLAGVSSPEEFANQDPFGGDGTPTPWQTSGNGLQLEVLNALQPKWYDFFYKAIRDWDNGYPDALTLQTTVVDHDPNCTAVTGKVKVCNANYGATKWRGIVDFSTVNGFMTVAVARMNENYTGNVNTDSDRIEMHYVMCHELGHAWGLVHSDENFDNADLNDCLEYTRTPQTSQTPADFQFVNLYKLYGLAADAAPYSSPPTPAPAPVVQDNGGGGGGGTRQIRQQLLWQNEEDGMEPLPPPPPPPPPVLQQRHGQYREEGEEDDIIIMMEDRLLLEEAIASVYHRPTGTMLDPSQWTLVHRNEFSEAHEIDLTSWWWHDHNDRHDEQQHGTPPTTTMTPPRQHLFRVHKLLALVDDHKQ